MFRYRTSNYVLPLVACFYALYGVVMLVQPASRTQGAVYRQAFDLAARQVWAVAFILVGLFVLITLGRLAAGLLMALIALWALLLLVAAVQTKTISLTGVVLNGGYAVLLFVSLIWAGVREAP